MSENTIATQFGWSFTKDDFSTDIPYTYIYDLKRETSAFQFELIMRAMADYAKSVGFNGFKNVFKEYMRTITGIYREEIDIYGKATHFTGQEICLESGYWECGDDGIKRTNGMAEEIACRHPIIPVERLVNIDTGAEKLKLAFCKGKSWRTLVVDKTVLASSSKVTDLAGRGIAVNSQNAKLFIEYISDIENMNYDLIPESKSIGRLGYIEGEGFSPYVDGLTFDGDASFQQLFQSVSCRGSFDEWKKTAITVRNMSTTAKIVLAASFASVLLAPLNSLPFFVHLWGVDSGTGKTVALMVAASVWGNPAIGSYVKTFDGTVVGHEKTAAFLNHLPLCLDELQLAKDSRGQTQFDVYKLAQGVGRTRGNRAGGVDMTPTWKNCIITTGESPLTGSNAGAGAVNRVIDIECQSGQPVITDGMAVSASIKRNYGFAGKEFVWNLYKDGVIDGIIDRYQMIFKQLSETDTTEKQAMAAAAIVLADQLVCEWILPGEKPLTEETIGAFLASKAAVSAGDRGYKFLCDWVSQNAASLCQKSESIKVLGALEGNKAYIIRTVFIGILQDAGFSSSAMISYLVNNGLLETRGRAKTRNKRINGIATECFCLLLSQEDEIGEIDDDLPL